MKTINVDGEEYVPKAELDKMRNECEQKLLEKKVGFEVISKEMMLDEANVLGLGTVRVGQGFHAVKLSTMYLEKIVRLLKSFSCSKSGLEAIDIVWSSDKPCIIGRLGKDGMVTGFVLAPRVGEE